MHPRRIAVFSDVHGNLEALKAVLADMKKAGVQDQLCLGDVVGYGPDPAQCLEIVRQLGCPILLGNHDEGCIASDSDSFFNLNARAALEYTRGQLSDAQKKFLKTLPLKIEGKGFTAVHASLNEEEPWFYVFDALDAAFHFRHQNKPICFCGHTHKPAVWRQDDRGVHAVPRAYQITLDPGAKYLINVGSVGQSRSSTSDACYVIFEPRLHQIEYRLVPYAYAKTQRKIMRAGLPHYLAQRLALGR